LTSRNPDEVVAAVDEWVKQFDAKKPEHARNLVEALWVHQQTRRPNEALLTAVLASAVADARAAGVRVLRDTVREAKLLSPLSPDSGERARVRGPKAATVLTSAASNNGARQAPSSGLTATFSPEGEKGHCFTRKILVRKLLR
jgi:phage terminase large subunit GpA-like protein